VIEWSTPPRTSCIKLRLLQWRPAGCAAEMDGHTHQSMKALCAGTEQLGHDQDRAARSASEAIKVSRGVEHAYRRAITVLIEDADLRSALGRSEMYRRYAETGSLVAATGDRLWFAVLAEG